MQRFLKLSRLPGEQGWERGRGYSRGHPEAERPYWTARQTRMSRMVEKRVWLTFLGTGTSGLFGFAGRAGVGGAGVGRLEPAEAIFGSDGERRRARGRCGAMEGKAPYW